MPVWDLGLNDFGLGEASFFANWLAYPLVTEELAPEGRLASLTWKIEQFLKFGTGQEGDLPAQANPENTWSASTKAVFKFGPTAEQCVCPNKELLDAVAAQPTWETHADASAHANDGDGANAVDEASLKRRPERDKSSTKRAKLDAGAAHVDVAHTGAVAFPCCVPSNHSSCGMEHCEGSSKQAPAPVSKFPRPGSGGDAVDKASLKRGPDLELKRPKSSTKRAKLDADAHEWPAQGSRGGGRVRPPTWGTRAARGRALTEACLHDLLLQRAEQQRGLSEEDKDELRRGCHELARRYRARKKAGLFYLRLRAQWFLFCLFFPLLWRRSSEETFVVV